MVAFYGDRYHLRYIFSQCNGGKPKIHRDRVVMDLYVYGFVEARCNFRGFQRLCTQCVILPQCKYSFCAFSISVEKRHNR